MTDDESGKLDQLFPIGDGEPARDSASELKGQIAALLWEKRYEEALDLLYAARWHSPDAAEVSRGINLLKERLVRRYVEQLGDLDAVPSIAPGVNRATIEIADEERALLHLIDGISSFADIAHQSRLGRFETYRALGRVVGQGLVEVAPPPAPTPLPAPRRARVSAPTEISTAGSAPHATPGPGSPPMGAAAGMAAPAPAPPRHRWRGLLVGAASFAITAVVGLTWWALTGTAPSLHPGAAVAGVPTGSTSLPAAERVLAAAVSPRSPTPAAPAGPGAPGVRQVALIEPDLEQAQAPADSSRSTGPVTTRRSSRSAARSEEHSKKRSSSRGAAAAELAASGRPRSSSGTGSGGRPAAEPSLASAGVSEDDERDAPSLPELPPSGPRMARPAVLAAPSSSASSPRPATGGAVSAPQGLVKASATAPTSLSVATLDLSVRGPLGRSVVEQAVARTQADFRACYSSRAAALRRESAGTARISLTIDEAGYATAVSAQGAPLPGLDGCLQEAASRIRTRVHPDVGVATVTFAVAFSIGGPAR